MREQKLKLISKLIEKFQKNETEYSSKTAKYNETEVRVDFINEFFEILGWDIKNKEMLPKPMREVVAEANITDKFSNRKPDYEFRINAQRQFFVEAKKPSVDIMIEGNPAYQTRRYGWSANLSVSILTNFKDLVIYDCTIIPYEGDNPRIAKARHYNYKEYATKFDEIYSLISKEAVTKGSLESEFVKDFKPNKVLFDSYFLEQIEKWRKLLAEDIIKTNTHLDEETLNQIVQVFINRLIFLRICEDRSLEKYGELKNLPVKDVFENLLNLFYKADKKYDSGLFDFIHDTLTPKIKVSDTTIINIVNDFYYPNSPYTFSVVEPKILGDIYEHFLSRRIIIEAGSISVEQKPEVKAANGVYTTPKFIVDFILDSTLNLSLNNEEIDSLTIADIACGSGIFLIEAYDVILNYYLKQYIEQRQYKRLRKDSSSDFQLTLSERKRILLKHIYGVDIDSNATEVTKFSLLLKVLEDVTEGEIEVMIEKGEKALLNLDSNIKTGNSLISEQYFEHKKIQNISISDLKKINPFNFQKEFPQIFNQLDKGFSIIVGNPPYIKIQRMVAYSPEEVEYYHNSISEYLSSKENSFDKYMLFVERSLRLLKSNGLLGYIIPHKFMTIKAGEAMRRLISEHNYLKRIIHFGSEQVFGNQATTYTSILVLQKSKQTKFEFQNVTDLKSWKLDSNKSFELIQSNQLDHKPWTFDHTLENSFRQDLLSPNTLGSITEIFVGLQTSADDIFIVEAASQNDKYITFKDTQNKEWVIESEITKPAILDYRVDCFAQIKPNKRIIFPYVQREGINILISENEFTNRFPKTLMYLNNFKDILLKRHFSNSNPIWYQYGRSQSLQKFDSDKLIIKNPASIACVVLDKKNTMFTGGGNGPYYGIRSVVKEVDNMFLLALMNSSLFDKWVKARSSIFRGGYYSFGKQFINNFPIPKHSKERDEMMEEIILVWKQIDALNVESEKIVLSDHKTVLRKKQLLKESSDKLIEKMYKG